MAGDDQGKRNPFGDGITDRFLKINQYEGEPVYPGILLVLIIYAKLLHFYASKCIMKYA